jgi:hypothetical protein
MIVATAGYAAPQSGWTTSAGPLTDQCVQACLAA